MRYLIMLLLFFTSLGCQQQQELERKEEALLQKEQQLLIKEKELALREEELLKRESKLDSTDRDSLLMPNVQLQGRWNVQMVCTETTCPGSAVGDTRNEQWDISYLSNRVVARVINNETITRVYVGFYTGNTLELVEDVHSTANQPATKIVVRLRIISETRMEGQREIERGNDCKIIYSIQMDKKQ